MTGRELVVAALRGESVPRPPVICGGGMMSLAIVEAMAASGAAWPAAHCDAELMAKLALETQRLSGFDCVAVPFCMTVEAEMLGATVDMGSREVQPRVAAEPMRHIGDLNRLRTSAAHGLGRADVTAEAIGTLRGLAPDVAVIGATLGPLSLAGQVLEASLLLRALRREPAAAHELLARCTEVAADVALRQVRAGADAIAISDPTATGEVLGDGLYREFAGPYVRRVADGVRENGVPVIVHICGRPNAILGSLAGLGVDCISLDETASLARAREALAGCRLMGNVRADLLQRGPAAAVAANCRAALRQGVDILAPACGVIAATPSKHLRAMGEVARE